MSHSNAVMGIWGSAVKTSASYNWRNSRPNFNYNSGPTFIRTVNAKGPQGRPKPVKAWGTIQVNKNQLEDFEEFNRGSITFGGSKGYISGKGNIRNNPKIQAFRRELEQIALKHLGTVPENNSTSTPSVNTGSQTVNTGRLDHDDSRMPELEIFHKPETGIFNEASYDEEGVITDFNSLPTEMKPMRLLQFKLQQVWVLVDLPHGMKVIGTKWVYRNKRDERDEEVYVSQPPGFVDHDHLYKVLRWSSFVWTCIQAPRVASNKHHGDQGASDKGNEEEAIDVMESPFDLEAFSDSDYGGSNLDRKSTTGGCQFLGQRLISWQCKKQTIVATSTTEAEYVAAANCCGQVLWVQNQLLDYGFNFMNTKIHIDNESTICIVKNPVYHSKTKHIEIRHHFIRDCYEKKLISVEKIHTDLNVADLLTKPFDGPRFNYLVVSIGFAEIVDFLRGSNLRYALTSNPTIYDSLVKQFWQTATTNTIADGTLEINATIDTIGYTITEASIRDTLQLGDATGITMLPNDELFEGMGQMGYPTDGTFTFWKSFFTPQWRYLVHHLLHCISSKSGGWDQFGSNIATALICLSTGRVYNFSKLIFDGMVANLKSKTKFLMYPRFLQMILNIQTENKHLYLAVSLTKKIFGNMKRGFRGAPRPLLPAMLLVATNPNAGQEHDAVAQSQPSSSTPPVPSTSSTQVQTPPPIPTPTPPPIPTPTPIPETEPASFEHIYEEPSPVVPQLISRIDSLETDLKQTKLTMGNALVKLVKKVKKLEGFLKRRKMVLSDSEEEEPEAQGRKSQDDPLDSLVQGLVTPSTTKVNASGEEQVEDISPNTLEAAKTLSRVATLEPKSIDKGRRYKRRKETKGKKVVSSLDFQEEIDTGAEQVNTAKGVSTGSTKLSTGSEQVSTVGDKKSTPSPDKGQRAGKAPMIIEETPKKSKEQILQEEASLAEAIRLDTLQKEEVAKQVHLDSLLAQRIAEEEEHKEIANQGTWKLSQLKNLSFEEVKKEFDKLVKQVESFAPINFEATKASLNRFGEKLQTKTSKRLKSDEAKDVESSKKSGKIIKHMARKGLHKVLGL
ncbi:hypothetical protein Tco_0846331 [Tanacetum coccineum]